MKPTQHLEVKDPQETGPHNTSADAGEEIDFVDLARLIWRHRRAAALTLLVVLAIGMTGALLTPRKYAYTTAIEIGSRVEDGKTTVIEAPDTVVAKLEDGYIPLAQQSYADDHPEDKSERKVAVRLPKNSQLVVIQSKSTVDEGAAYRQIQQKAVEALVADHARVYDTARQEIEFDRKRAERELRGLADQQLALTRELERTKTTQQLLEGQIAETTAMIEANTKNRDRAVAEARDEARAMTLLMLDNEVRANRTRLANLERDLRVHLDATRDSLQNQLLDNQRAQELKQAQIQRIMLQLKNLRETRAVNLGARSLRAVGPSRGTIILVSAVMAVLLALLVPLVIDFISRVRKGTSPPLGPQDTPRLASGAP